MRRLILILAAGCLCAANRPDLSGEWRLAPARSRFANEPPKSKILQIDHREPALVLTTVEEGRTTFHSTDGIERVNDLDGRPLRSIARWDETTLELRASGKSEAGEIVRVDRYQLSSGGETLIQKRREGSAEGQEQELVYERVPLKAGVARVEITPSEFMPMYGYANRKCGPANGYHDALFAKALVLESAAVRMAIVTLDLGSMVSDRLRGEAAEKLKIPFLLLASSHTHSAPFFLPPAVTPASALGPAPEGAPAFLDEVERKVLDALGRASESMFPARLRVAKGSARLGYNRLVAREHGRARAVFDNLERVPYGPVDPEFDLLEVSDDRGSPRALLVHYAVHPVVLGPTNCKYSADFPGVMQASVESAVDGVQAMFVQGGAGDINPLFLGRSGKEEEDFAQVRRMGELLAAAVINTRSGLREVRGASQPLRAKSDVLRFADRWENGRTHEVGITTVLIGREIAIAAMPGEPLHRLQRRWKQEADVSTPLFYGYTYSSGGHWTGYIPDLRSAAYGGYGADSTTTRVEVGAGETVLQRHLTNLFALRGFWRASPGLP